MVGFHSARSRTARAKGMALVPPCIPSFVEEATYMTSILLCDLLVAL